ncbi:hypothetical protein EJB05_51840, partial [Eragrostis curvula]
MRKPVPFLKDEDLEKGLDDLADGAAGFLTAGLCCPDDLLDDVMDCFVAPAVDDGFLEALGIGGGGGAGGCSPPRLDSDRRTGDGDGGGMKDLLDVVSAPMLAAAKHATPGGGGGGGADLPPSRGVLDDFKDVDFDVDMFFADDVVCLDSNVSRPAPVTAALPANSCGAVDASVVHDRAPTWPARGPDVTSGALNGVTPDSASPLPARNTADVFDELDGVLVPYRAPAPLPACGLAYACSAQDSFATDYAPPALALDAVPAWPSTASSTSSSGCLSSMTWETESPARVSPPRAWIVPRKKKRHQPITRRNHFWLPKSHPYLLPANAPPRDTNPPSCLKSAGDSDSGSGNSTAGVRLLQRPKAATAAPRQRNRQRQRACTHCSNTETPQWRAGPRGPGTLCNACGIRFKNGKLFEEYRPSTSPSFESDKHSNRHRKVVKLRERKALLGRMPDDDDDKKTVLVLPPPTSTGGQFMDVCTYIATG